MNQNITRRDFIKLMGLGAGTLTLSACGLIPPNSRFAVPTTAPVILTPLASVPVSLAVDLTAGRATLPIFSGAETPVWRYQPSVREGSAESIQELSGSYLGPIFRVKTGQRIQVRLKNDLPDPTIIHWHGLLIPEEMDGHPRYAIAPGASYEYDFQVITRLASTAGCSPIRDCTCNTKLTRKNCRDDSWPEPPTGENG
jgi:FtsP/CotA-like multicopper oxidase with cupredoxin domain